MSKNTYCLQSHSYSVDYPEDTCFAEVVAALEHFGTLTERTYELIPSLIDSLKDGAK